MLLKLLQGISWAGGEGGNKVHKFKLLQRNILYEIPGGN